MQQGQPKNLLRPSLLLLCFLFFLRAIPFFNTMFAYLSSILLYPLLCVSRFYSLFLLPLLLHLGDVNQLQNRMILLTQERDKAVKELVELKAALSYTKQTELLKITSSLYDNTNLVAIGGIMMRSLLKKEQFFLIDAGMNQHVEIDMLVVYERCLVGRITEVYPFYSKAMLITDQNCKLAVFVGQQQISALYEVDDQLGPHLSYIEQPELIQNGDLVISSGQGSIFPYGFAIGTVVKNKQESSFSMKLFGDLKNLRYCAILSRK